MKLIASNTTIKKSFLSTVLLASTIVCFFVFLANKSEEQFSSGDGGLKVSKSSAAQPIRRVGGGHDRMTDSRDIVSFESAILSKNNYNITSEDLLVLLHIQKTGGTAFERHLVHDLQIPVPCTCNAERRRCSCPRPLATSSLESNLKRQTMQSKTLSNFTWLISRFSIGWACGLHPDFTQLRRCLFGLKRLFFLTFLRHPLNRFISEYRHVRRGATWKASKGHCKNHNTQLCYKDRAQWANASLEEFINCPSNMAINRQTRMLASFNNFLCDASHVENSILLASAMSNLDQISFFGICEQQRASQLLFERTFNLKFAAPFKQSDDNETRALIAKLPDGVKERILQLNSLDVKLYDYAIDLFAYRCNQLTNSDDCGTKIIANSERI